MLNALSRAFFLAIASNRTLKRLASRYGLRKPTSFGRRFIAGETTAEAIAAAGGAESARATAARRHGRPVIGNPASACRESGCAGNR